MSKIEMTKKHLITCSVILVLVIISRLNIYSTEPVFTPKIIVNTHSNYIFNHAVNDAEVAYNFANEALPVNDKRVDFKLKKSIAKHGYKTVQSNVLHAKADKMFPIIEPILKAYGIPEDFKYVPLVESGLCEGTSPKGARGVWQFMPGTARTYGLKVGKGKDDRLNLRKSTIAACKYIKELYGEFNSWTLAAAAYNNGSIKLERAMNKQNEDNYFRMTLNRETGSYVYKLVAMKEIINKPAKYGYKNFYSYMQKPMPFLVAHNN
ncbi:MULTISPECIES: lytic transglycosylase domain-containing protein [unclassified Mucilaginibacter]|uniref:lytic transglycosylase domain-containing protein n=1 Tax=unclassified Mucilaginibacter TaxID=2617802 RepID=UPI002AC947C7|nr:MULTISPECIES: lytic transglycosylase domain-containing protein [unclassified Mucilaginibacter]MEB0263615.1 lytic transglycosylase domain-containing protein [Mucilaginibacter sp. 10I4]MEB0278630.1 lytic transglycosylase domain-containing protein [Mucilaginibacter sp. 10B2]MEB0299340.1 lytic transglycosylase domain-containing protein [Mucilaginibacter sp. 5C4]WPX23416.1 lytic transglycosylase domain-containing protein [Mucilaginibacter sp. 5C4]